MKEKPKTSNVLPPATSPALSRHFVTEIPLDMQADAPPRRDWGSLPFPLLRPSPPPINPPPARHGGMQEAPPALNYSVTNTVCTFPHQPRLDPVYSGTTQADPRQEGGGGITTSQYLDQSATDRPAVSEGGKCGCFKQQTYHNMYPGSWKHAGMGSNGSVRPWS